MSRLVEDVRYGIRVLGRSPGLTLVAALSLALGIGANSAIFSAADSLLFRPLLLPDLDRLVTVFERNKNMAARQVRSISGPDYLDIREQAKSFEKIAGYRWWQFNITEDGEPEAVRAVKVTAQFFDVLEVQPALGRAFTTDEEQPGRDFTAVLSDGLWQRRYDRDPHILGRTIRLDGAVYKVVGVMPPQVRYPPEADLWIPWAMTTAERNERGMFFCYGIARLKDNVPLRQAQEEVAGVARRVFAQYPNTHSNRAAWIEPVRETISGTLTADYTRLLLWAVGFVLVIACANVANLLLSRLASRSREFAIRSALGASRWRVARQLLTESLLLSCAGSAAGLVLAMWGVDTLRASMPATVEIHLPGWSRMGIHTPTLLYTLAIALAGGLFAGLAPALIGSRTNLAEELKSGGRGSAGSRRHLLGNVFVVAQIVLAVVLLVGAGLLVKGASSIATPAPGLEPEKVIAIEIALPERGYSKEHERALFAGAWIERLRALPGAVSVGLVTDIPYSGGSSNSRFTVEGRPEPLPGESPQAQLQSATTDYFRTARIALRQGRLLADTDGEDSQRVAVVSETLVRRYFPGEDPLGKRLRIASSEPWFQIVGVVADIRHDPYDRDLAPVIYRPFTQSNRYDVAAVVRVNGDSRRLMNAVREQVHAIDPLLPVARMEPWKKMMDDELCRYTYIVALIGLFGIVALVLSATGVYSVMAHSVSERTREIGVRMAMGADQNDVLGMVLRRGMALAGAGLVCGVAGGVAIARLLSTLLFGVGSADLVALAGVTVVIGLSALLACWFPARRAARVDPIVALRCD